MSELVRIEGMSEVLRMFDAAPEELQKAARRAMRSGASASQRMMRSRIPSRWRKLMRNRVSKRGDLVADIGLYNRGQSSGSGEAPDWFKAYWANYGTLQGRDPSHTFDRPVRPSGSAAGRRRRNDRGQRHQNFFESAAEGWHRTFYDTFLQSMKEQGYDIAQ